MKTSSIARLLLVLTVLLLLLSVICFSFPKLICNTSTPTTQASGLNLYPPDNNYETAAVEFEYLKGNGDFTVVITNPYHSVNVSPNDGAYLFDQGDTRYGYGFDLGDGNYVTYVGFESPNTQVSNFVVELPKTGEAHFAVFEFNYDFENDCAKFLTTSTTNYESILY